MPFMRFFSDRKGGVTPLLALGIVPIVGAVGAAIDYSRANSVRTAMQAAGDAAALLLAKGAANMTPDQLQQNATAYFLANFHRPEAQGLQVSATYGQGPSGLSVTVNGTAKVNTSFIGLLGFSQIPLTTTGTVAWSNARLRVALVL